jgi:DNA-directed RNA polymerase specialized sigma24 family protein
MPQMLPLDDRVISTPAEKALALNLVTATDLLRLKTIARLHARGLPAEVGWDDLLQEAFARVLVGSRRQPEGVAMIAFLAGVMRSLKAEHWRRTLKAFRYQQAATGDSWDGEPCDAVSDPERSLSAQQELAAIEMLFKDDPLALQIIAGLAEGLSAEQIRVASGISGIDYDSARRRMRRLLLREGLTSCQQR